MIAPTTRRGPLLASLFTLACACASAPPPASTSPADTAAPPAASAAAASAPPAETAAPQPQRPLDLTSACPKDVHLYYGDHPGDGKGAAATVATGATVPVPRKPDGTQVVWVTDDKGFGLASVNITKHMRHIRIDPACMHIDADSTK
jgi:hypothetical protein